MPKLAERGQKCQNLAFLVQKKVHRLEKSTPLPVVTNISYDAVQDRVYLHINPNMLTKI